MATPHASCSNLGSYRPSACGGSLVKGMNAPEWRRGGRGDGIESVSKLRAAVEGRGE
jgi:hypothetical protein